MNHPMLNNVGHSAFSFARASLLMSSRRSRRRFFQNTNFSGSSLLGRTRHISTSNLCISRLLLCVSSYKDVVFRWFLFEKKGNPNPCFLHQVFLDAHPKVAKLWFWIRLSIHSLELISYNLYRKEGVLVNFWFAKFLMLS